MPVYTFRCAAPGCAHEEDILCAYADRLGPHGVCPEHATPLMWRGFDAAGAVNAKGRYQMQAVTSAGAHVPGHFGKTAPKGRGHA